MNKLAFMTVFAAEARQLKTFPIIEDWVRLAEQLPADGITLTGADAARWANAGCLPGEAEESIRAGIRPETADELDRLATDIAGGSEQRAAQRVDELVRDGVLVDPAQVRQVQDPDDPNHIVVHIDDHPIR